MKKLFEQYGGVITTTIAIVALIGVISLMFTGNGTGWMENSFGGLVSSFEGKAVYGKDYSSKYDSVRGGKYYTDFAVALADANAQTNENGTDNSDGAVAYVKVLNGESVLILLDDVEITSTVITTNNVVLNLAGKTINTYTNVFIRANSGTLTVRDITGKGTVNKSVVGGTKTDTMFVSTGDGTQVIIDGGNYITENATTTGNLYTYLAQNGAVLTINDAKTTMSLNEGGKQVALINTTSAAGTSVTINDGTFDLFNRSSDTTACGVLNFAPNFEINNADISVTLDAAQANDTSIVFGINNKSDSNFVINNVTITACNNAVGTSAYGICNYDGSLTITSANITCDSVNKSDGDGAGLGITNLGTLTLKGNTNDDIKVKATREALSLQTGSKNYIYNGTYEGCQHGGAYVTSGSTGETVITGGIFRNIDAFGGWEENSGTLHYGGMYLGCPKDEDAGAWSVDISNATITGGIHGVALQAHSGDYVVPTVNFTDCTLTGTSNDLRVDSGGTANLYGSTVLTNNKILYNGGTVNDYR